MVVVEVVDWKIDGLIVVELVVVIGFEVILVGFVILRRGFSGFRIIIFVDIVRVVVVLGSVIVILLVILVDVM